MKILFLMIAYPDAGKNTNMYTDLVQEFNKAGHSIYVAAPTCNRTKLTIEGGINVLRIQTHKLFKTSIIKKGFANILLPFQYKKAIGNYLKGICFDLIITPTPPISFADIAASLKWKYNSRVYLILRDIFPQNAKDLGLIKSNIIFYYFRRKEKFLYQISDAIGCMSPKNIQFVINHNPEIDKRKLHLLPNWLNLTKEFTLESNFRRLNKLEDKFLAVFGGNFGIPQKIEFLIEVAEKIRTDTNIRFLLIGEGTEKSRIEKLVKDKKLENVMIMDQLPRAEYLSLIKDCDVGLVNLSEKFTIPNIPSRTLAYWSLKLPVLAAIDKNTDFGDMLTYCDGGLWSVTGDIQSYIENLYFLQKSPEVRRKMGENGYNYLKQELNSGKAFQTIISVFE